MGTGVFIITLLINIIAESGAIGTLFSATQHPQEPPREEQTVSRENHKAGALPDIISDEAQSNETPSAEER